ncbi:MAG: hypothetical protein L3J39_18540 [Verrucomicrobiales bacterium]|nr:hypothetical protein [Verrucomicrobiales bacterium]
MKANILHNGLAVLVALANLVPAANAGDTPEAAIAPPVDDSSFYIYADVWAVGIKGDVGVGGLSKPVDVGFDDILDNLDASLAGGFGYQNGKWGFLTEALWLKISSDAPTPGPLFRKADIGVEQLMADGHISYRIFECSQGKGYLDVIGGVRYTYIKTSLSLAPGLASRRISAAGSKSWWDGYGGVKGRYNITDKWFVPFRADVGGGGSAITWQAMGGIGYQFNPMFDVNLAYRYMAVDYSDGGFIYDVASSGPMLTLGCKF